MGTYVMLTELSPGDTRVPSGLRELERRAVDQVRACCPEVRWRASYALLGKAHYLDVFEAPSNESAAKTAAIIRAFGHARTEVWPAVEWDRFKELLGQLPAAPA